MRYLSLVHLRSHSLGSSSNHQQLHVAYHHYSLHVRVHQHVDRMGFLAEESHEHDHVGVHSHAEELYRCDRDCDDHENVHVRDGHDHDDGGGHGGPE